MSAIEPLCHLVGIDSQNLSKDENLILEAALFARLCEELQKIYKVEYKDFFRYQKITEEKEDAMIESNFIRCLINDIISTKTYTLSGIAYYTHIPEDVIYEVAMGSNESPTLALPRRVIELHKTVRPDLYREIMRRNKVPDLDKTGS